MAYRIISADRHLDLPWLPADLFVSNAPANLKDKMPRVVDTDQGPQWMVEGRLLAFVAGAGLTGAWDSYAPGESTRLDRMESVGFWSDGAKGLLRPGTAELRIEDQKRDGIDAEVIYGVLGLAGGIGSFEDEEDQSYGIHDREVLRSVYEIYNKWAAGFSKSHPGRFAPLASLCNYDPALAAQQLRGAAEIGLRGAEMNAATAVKPIYHEDWDVLWAAAAECGIPLSFHSHGLHYRTPDAADAEKYRWVDSGLISVLFQLAGAEILNSIIYSGACERHPDFKFVLGECGIGWIPYVLYRMDDEFERIAGLKLNMKPSEYWLRQGHSTFQIEPVTPEILSRVGEDNVMWGSDYPHPDGVYPDSQQVIQDHMGQLDERVRHKIVCGDAARSYGFE